MTNISYILLASVIGLVPFVHHNQEVTASDQYQKADFAPKGDWQTLFDGSSLAFWHAFNGKEPGKAWKIENGILHLDGAAKKQGSDGGDLTTNDEYENFDLKLEWKISEKGNSGIIIYSI